MERTPSHTLLESAHEKIQQLRSLPEDTRKVFASASMIAGAFILIALLWVIVPPLHNLSETSQEIPTMQIPGDERPPQILTSEQITDPSTVPEVAPLAGFIDSFKAAKDLIVPQYLQEHPFEQANTITIWSTIRQSLFHMSGKIIIAISPLIMQTRSMFIQGLQEINLLLSSFLTTIIVVVSRISF